MAYKKKTQSNESWNTTIAEIKTNIKGLRDRIMKTLNNPVYPVEYPNVGNYECPLIKKEVSMHEFWEIWNEMEDDFCAVQAKIALPVINERFQLPNVIRHDLNNLITEINRLERIVKNSKLEQLLKQLDEKSQK